MVDPLEVYNAKYETAMHEIDHTNDRCDNLENRMGKIESRYDILYEMTSSLKVISNKMETVDNKIEDLRTDFKNDISVVREKQDQHEHKLSLIEGSSANKDHILVEKMKEKFITIVITGIIVAMLAYLFPTIKW